MSSWIAAFIALFVWWFSTGAILMAVKHADRRGHTARTRMTWAGLPLVGIGLVGLWISLGDATISGAYVGFLAALSLWGWIELAFLTGVLTGPNLSPLPDRVSERERFLRAWGTIAYHEITLLFALVAILLLCWGAENAFGLWTFVILYGARISAKLNLYFGVPKVQIDFLPEALSHLPSHFRIQRMSWFFPISITLLSFAIGYWLQCLYSAQTPGQVTGFALLTALTGLALFEHWMMVLPIPDERLWRWMLPKTPSAPTPRTSKDIKGGQHGL